MPSLGVEKPAELATGRDPAPRLDKVLEQQEMSHCVQQYLNGPCCVQSALPVVSRLSDWRYPRNDRLLTDVQRQQLKKGGSRCPANRIIRTCAGPSWNTAENRKERSAREASRTRESHSRSVCISMTPGDFGLLRWRRTVQRVTPPSLGLQRCSPAGADVTARRAVRRAERAGSLFLHSMHASQSVQIGHRHVASQPAGSLSHSVCPIANWQGY